MYYLGIDLGGTNIAVGIVNERGEILSRKSVPTQTELGEDAVITRMAEAARSLTEEAGIQLTDIVSVGVGSPGAIDSAAGVVVSACNLPFSHTPLAVRLEALLGRPVRVENDANVAAWAEATAGAARGTRDSVMLTLGTGVGGGIVIGGRLYGGFNNYGGEFGHMIIRDGGEMCACGQSGCLEAYASATALIRETRRAAEADKQSLLWACAEEEGKFSGKTAFAAAEKGDAAAKAVIDRYVYDLSLGVINLIRIFQPEVVVVGGGVARAGEALMAPLREKLHSYITGAKAPRVEAASLGDDAGIVGAALLGMEA